MLDFIVHQEEADQTIISFLKKRFKTTPLSLIYKLFRTKKVKVDGKNIRYYHHRLKKGERINIYDDSVKIFHPSATSPVPKKSSVDFEINYEDSNVLIIVKNHGTTMTELDEAVRYYFHQQDPKKYQELVKKYFSFTSVHRLDKLTKGLVIYPKNPESKKILYNSINDKSKITKKYLAVCENKLQKDLLSCIEGYIWKNDKEQKMQFGLEKESSSDAKYCSLEIKKIGNNKKNDLLEITLNTGRKHQIRAILSYFGYPIVGDKKYGSKTEVKDRIYLLAYKIEFNNLSSPLVYLNERVFTIEKEKLNYWKQVK